VPISVPTALMHCLSCEDGQSAEQDFTQSSINDGRLCQSALHLDNVAACFLMNAL